VADLQDLNPEFTQRMNALIAAAAAQGIKTNIISAARTPEDQRQLLANAQATRSGAPLPYPARGPVPMAAPVGSSLHEYGLAADIEAADPSQQAALRALAPKYGLNTIGPSDPTHFQMVGNPTDLMKQYPMIGSGAAPSGSPIAPNPQPISSAPPGTTLNSSPLASNHAQFIQNYARSIGVDPNLALGIANAEGLKAWSASNPNAGSTIDRTNGQPFSFGDFQLNIHPGAMGAQALAAGVDPRDPNQWQAADRFALDQMKTGGVAPWKGDPVAKAYLATGATPNMSALLAQAQNAPISTTPGTASAGAAGSPASAAATSAAGAGVLPGFGTAQASNSFLQGANTLDKAFGGKGAPGQQGTGQGAGGDQIKPSPMISGPPAVGVSPLMGQAMATYGQTLNSMRQPPQWGPGTPGSASPFYASAGPQTMAAASQGLEAQQLQQLQQLSNPMMLQMMGMGYG
jgi:hypothetical protein